MINLSNKWFLKLSKIEKKKYLFVGTMLFWSRWLIYRKTFIRLKNMYTLLMEKQKSEV